MRRKRGFTLVELMVVIAILSVIMALAVKAFRKSRSQSDVDYWANALRNQINAASKRALSTKSPYLVSVTATTVRWCQVNPANISGGPPWTTSQVTCPAQPTTGGPELGPIITAPDDGETSYYATSADATMPGVTAYSQPTRTTLSGSAALYVGEFSTASSIFDNVMRATLSTPNTMGFSLYVRRQGSDETDKRRRVVVYGASARVRIIDNY
jgi:prepilin-type N-terminal cleavage/methylation domain-containing protein